LAPLVYKELHRLAHRYMAREAPGHPLQTTELVNEVYLRLVDASAMSWHDRAHFFAVCARMMRRTLIDFARARQYQKRSGKAIRVSLDNPLGVAGRPALELVAVDDALTALAQLDSRKGQVVELRFFGGLSVEETAGVLKVSRETVLRDWKFARAWLRRELDKSVTDKSADCSEQGSAAG
jgi:RNA polymerase sigma factor (TIGR02999 family)